MDENSGRSPRWTPLRRRRLRSPTGHRRAPHFGLNSTSNGRSRSWKSARPRWSGTADNQLNNESLICVPRAGFGSSRASSGREMYMWIVTLAFMRLYAFKGRKDTCLSFDSGCFGVVRMIAPRFDSLLDFNDMGLSRSPECHSGAVVACSKEMVVARDRRNPDSALLSAESSRQTSVRSAIVRGSICG